VAGQLNTEEEDANCKPKVMKRRSVCHCSPISIIEHYTQLSTFVKYQNLMSFEPLMGEYFKLILHILDLIVADYLAF